MHVMTYISVWYTFHTSYSHQLQFVVFSFLILSFFFLLISRVQNITNETILYSSNVIYKNGWGWGGGGGGGGVLQICSTVHIFAILRIYRRSLINSNKWGGGARGGELYETSIAIKSQNGCHGNPTLPCSFCHHLHSRLNKTMHST